MYNKKQRGGRRVQKKPCQYCVDKCESADYKDIPKIKRYISDRAKILPRRLTGLCSKHQRSVSSAIKIARIVALLPFTTS